MTEQRKLAAVMFTNIIGYTALMSKDEQKTLDSYFGFVPRVRNSSDTIHHGRIPKQVSKLGRTTLVQCTRVTIRYSPHLRNFYLRLKMGSGKAIISTARKLLGIIYKTLENDWIFEDFPNFVLKTE